jgi:putative FmdB family regulatory protein
MPIYDVRCEKCECIIEEILGMDDEPVVCECGGTRKKMPGGYFKLLYDNKKDCCSWGNEGYASSQYWKKVREQRAEGKAVKGCNED